MRTIEDFLDVLKPNPEQDARDYRRSRYEQDAIRSRLIRRLIRHKVELTTSQIEAAASTIYSNRLSQRFAKNIRASEDRSLLALCQSVGKQRVSMSFFAKMVRHRVKMNLKS